MDKNNPQYNPEDSGDVSDPNSIAYDPTDENYSKEEEANWGNDDYTGNASGRISKPKKITIHHLFNKKIK